MYYELKLTNGTVFSKSISIIETNKSGFLKKKRVPNEIYKEIVLIASPFLGTKIKNFNARIIRNVGYTFLVLYLGTVEPLVFRVMYLSLSRIKESQLGQH